MIDLHTHLDLYPNALKILAKTSKINRFTLAVTTSPRAWIATSRVFSGHDRINVALGLHPEIATEKFNELDLLLSSISKVDFVGEIGIDGSSRYVKSISKQEQIFDSAINECQRSGGRIISIHSRGAASKVLSILRKYPDCGKPILHWFSGSITDLKEAIDMKCFFSINPVMVKSNKGKELVSRIPPGFVLPESDGPFTTRNGKPIMPWEAMDIAPVLSKIWSVPLQQVEATLFENLNMLLEGRY